MQALHTNKAALQCVVVDPDYLSAAGSSRAKAVQIKAIVGDTSSTFWDDLTYAGSLLEPFATATQFLQVRGQGTALAARGDACACLTL